MISDRITHALAEDKPLGFTRDGGAMRYYSWKCETSQVDFWDTVRYCLDRGWIRETGAIDAAGHVLDWVGTDDSLYAIEETT